MPYATDSSPATGARAELRRNLACGAILATAFAFFAWRSWRTWPDILVDFGHELYIPWRLAEGEVLYRDIPFTMGPFSQYFNALLFRLFGVSLDTLIGANLTILAAIVAILFCLFRRCGGAVSATFVTVFFLAVFAFAQYSLIGNYNYVCPYRHEITHGIALGLAELVCLVRFAETRRAGWLTAAGLCVGLVGLTKLELLVPAISAAMAALVLVCVPRHDASIGLQDRVRGAPRGGSPFDARRSVGSAILFSLSTAVPIAIAVAALAIPLGWQEAFAGVFGNWRHSLNPALTRDASFYRSVSGIDRFEENVATILYAAMLLAIAVGAAYVIDRLFGRWVRSLAPAIGVGFVMSVAALLCVAPQEWSLLPAPLPLLLPIVIGVAALQTWRNASLERAPLTLCLLAVYALTLLPKIVLNVRWSHYGFALAMPGTLLLVHLLIQTIPAWLHRTRGSGIPFRAAWIGVLTVCVVVQYRSWDRIDRMKTQPIGDGRDRFLADPYFDDRVVPTARTIVSLEKALRPDDTLVVIPEGATLNFLLRKRNPTGLLIFNPWEFDVRGGEAHVLERLSAASPDFIVLVTMDMTDHGRGNFGNPQFGESIGEFIKARYHVIDTSANVDTQGRPTFQAIIFQRRRSTD